MYSHPHVILSRCPLPCLVLHHRSHTLRSSPRSLSSHPFSLLSLRNFFRGLVRVLARPGSIVLSLQVGNPFLELCLFSLLTSRTMFLTVVPTSSYSHFHCLFTGPDSTCPCSCRSYFVVSTFCSSFSSSLEGYRSLYRRSIVFWRPHAFHLCSGSQMLHCSDEHYSGSLGRAVRRKADHREP